MIDNLETVGLFNLTFNNGLLTTKGCSLTTFTSPPDTMLVGNNGGAATWTMAGGTNAIGFSLSVGAGANSTGAIWLTDGELVTTNDFSTVVIGSNGVGQVTLSNSTWLAHDLVLGYAAQGTLTIIGSTNTVSGGLTISSGVVWLTDGELTATNASTYIGTGRLTVSNGTWRARDVAVRGFPSLLTLAGGKSVISSNLTLGDFFCNAPPNVVVNGGSLFVTNATHNAVLEIDSGTLELDSGTLVVDKFVMTNACASFVRTGGTLIYGSAVLSSNLDADGDGISNGYEQSHGLDPLNAADANVDNDGDGFSNLQEFLAGTDPTNSASAFRITSIARTNNDLRVTWMTVNGKTNALQRTAGASGSYNTNNFTDIFTVTNTVGTATNYLDTGATAITPPALYYRIRLVP